jgi:hypothetical protein
MNIFEYFGNNDERKYNSHNIIENTIFKYDIKIVFLSILDHCISLNYEFLYRTTRLLSYIEELNIRYLKNDIYWNSTLSEKNEILSNCIEYEGSEGLEEKLEESIAKLKALIVLNKLQK